MKYDPKSPDVREMRIRNWSLIFIAIACICNSIAAGRLLSKASNNAGNCCNKCKCNYNIPVNKLSTPDSDRNFK